MSTFTQRIASVSFCLLDYFADAVRQCTHVRVFSEGDELAWLAHDDKHLSQINFTVASIDDCQIDKSSNGVAVTFRVQDFVDALAALPRRSERLTMLKSGGCLVLEEETVWEEASQTLAPFDFAEEFSFDEEWFARDPTTAQAELDSMESLALVKQVRRAKCAHMRFDSSSVSLRLPAARGIKTLSLRAYVSGPFETNQCVLRKCDVAFFDKLHFDSEGLLILLNAQAVSLGATDAYGIRWVRALPNAQVSMDHSFD